MKPGSQLLRHFLTGGVLILILSGCLLLRQLTESSGAGGTHVLEVMLKESYQGVKDGNIESVPLPSDSAYITVEMCVENLSAQEQSVPWQDVFITAEDGSPIYPVALGYDQAEAFEWLLPYLEPVGGKRIDHKFYFFLIQNSELLRFPAYQSQGCRDSSRFKSLALLFIVPEEMADQPYTLHFLEDEIPLAIKKSLPFRTYALWAAGLGLFFLILTVVAVVMYWKKLRSPKVDADAEYS